MKSNKWVRENTGIDEIAKLIAKRKWIWAGHIGRSIYKRWTRKMLDWKTMELNRIRGRPKTKLD